jgi:hypothetical protein
MREADFIASRRRFLGQLFGLAASVALAPSALDALERLAPRRLYVPAPPEGRVVILLDHWKEVSFRLDDAELVAELMRPDAGATLFAQRLAAQIDHDVLKSALDALDEGFSPTFKRPYDLQYQHDMVAGTTKFRDCATRRERSAATRLVERAYERHLADPERRTVPAAAVGVAPAARLSTRAA